MVHTMLHDISDVYFLVVCLLTVLRSTAVQKKKKSFHVSVFPTDLNASWNVTLVQTSVPKLARLLFFFNHT